MLLYADRHIHLVAQGRNVVQVDGIIAVRSTLDTNTFSYYERIVERDVIRSCAI